LCIVGVNVVIARAQAAATGNGEVVEYLIQHGVRTRVADSLGITPMSEARRRGRTTIVSMFERRGSVTALADLNGTDKFLHKT
jgi:ankyrin repeat protein